MLVNWSFAITVPRAVSAGSSTWLLEIPCSTPGEGRGRSLGHVDRLG